MVSTEEHNPVKGIAGVRDMLKGVDLSGLQGVRADYALPIAQVLAAQEPAVAYAHEPNEVRETVRPAPSLAVVNHDTQKQEVLEELTRLKHGRIAEIRSLIGMALDAGAKERLTELLERLENAVGRKDIEEALRDAAATLTSIHTGGSDKDDGVDEKFNKYLEQMDKLNAQAKEILDKLPLTDEQRAEQERLEKELEEAKKKGDKEAILAAQKNLAKFYNEMGIEHNRPELTVISDKMTEETKVVEIERAKKIDETYVQQNGAEQYKANAIEAAASNKDAKESVQLSLPSDAKYGAADIDISQSGNLTTQETPAVALAKSKSISLTGDGI